MKFSFILDAIKKEHKFEVPSEDLEKEYKNIAEKNKVNIAEVRRFYSSAEKKSELKDSIVRMKVMDFLKEKIKIKEV